MKTNFQRDTDLLSTINKINTLSAKVMQCKDEFSNFSINLSKLETKLFEMDCDLEKLNDKTNEFKNAEIMIRIELEHVLFGVQKLYEIMKCNH